MQTSYITVIIGILVPTVVLIAIIIRVCVMRISSRSSAAGGGGYSQVQHTLDEVEIEFKRMFETQSDNIDDIFGERGADSDLVFDTKDLDRLHMLEKYRNSLISGATAGDDLEAQEQTSPLKSTLDNDDIRV